MWTLARQPTLLRTDGRARRPPLPHTWRTLPADLMEMKGLTGIAGYADNGDGFLSAGSEQHREHHHE